LYTSFPSSATSHSARRRRPSSLSSTVSSVAVCVIPSFLGSWQRFIFNSSFSCTNQENVRSIKLCTLCIWVASKVPESKVRRKSLYCHSFQQFSLVLYRYLYSTIMPPQHNHCIFTVRPKIDNEAEKIKKDCYITSTRK